MERRALGLDYTTLTGQRRAEMAEQSADETYILMDQKNITIGRSVNTGKHYDGTQRNTGMEQGSAVVGQRRYMMGQCITM